MSSLRVNNRALTLAIHGLLAGSALALATHGFLQLPEPDVEVAVIEAPRAAAGGSAGCIEYLSIPQHWKYLSEARFILSADRLAKLSRHQPVEIKTLEPTKLRAIIDSNGEVRILSEAEWSYCDQDEDDTELVILLALKIYGDDYV